MLGSGLSTASLSSLKKGESGLILRINSTGDQYYRQKLLARGLLPGVEIQIKNTAPFGDPIEVVLVSAGDSIVLRKNEANIIKIAKLSSIA